MVFERDAPKAAVTGADPDHSEEAGALGILIIKETQP